jgi:hypothetical protein
MAREAVMKASIFVDQILELLLFANCDLSGSQPRKVFFRYLFWRGQASLTIFPFVLSRARALRLQLSTMMISGVNLSHHFTLDWRALQRTIRSVEVRILFYLCQKIKPIDRDDLARLSASSTVNVETSASKEDT